MRWTLTNYHCGNRTFRNHLSRCTALYYWPVVLPAPILQLSLTEWRTWLDNHCQRIKHNTINSNVLDANSWYRPGDRFPFQNYYRHPPHVAFINTAELKYFARQRSLHRDWMADSSTVKPRFTNLTFWRRNYFLNFSTPVYKMWIIQKPNTLELWNKLHFEEKKNGEYIPCLKYSVPIFVE